MNKKLRLVLALSVAVLMMNSYSTVKHRVFYIDAKAGDDANTGLSPEKAWATFSHLQEKVLQPGDHILIKAGTHYYGTLEIRGKGTASRPVIINSYGTGKKPVIHGEGRKKYTLRIYNSEYIEVKNLAVTNTGQNREAGRVGILIEAINSGDMHHIYLDSLDVHDVNGSLVKAEGGGSAIFWKNQGDRIPTRFVDLKIEHCHLYRCGRNGITSTGNISRKKWYPSLGVVIRGNLLEEIPGDGIVPIGCDGALIAYNVMRDCPDSLSFEEAAAGFWPWSSDHTMIQYNEVSGHRAKWDAQAYDCDFNCIGTTIRYNYSHDNYGGFLLVCNPGKFTPANINTGTKESVVQYNLSINDGIRPYPTEREGWFSPAIHISGPTENTLISNNILLIPKKRQEEIPVTFIETGNWGDAWPVKTEVTNNHIFASGAINSVWNGSTHTIDENNNKEPYKGRDRETVLSIIDSIIANTGPANREGYKKLRRFIASRIEVE